MAPSRRPSLEHYPSPRRSDSLRDDTCSWQQGLCRSVAVKPAKNRYPRAMPTKKHDVHSPVKLLSAYVPDRSTLLRS
ncbi:hypothetical protein SPRG_19865, partial [Saprolegnia parasitica CBS 223.65]